MGRSRLFSKKSFDEVSLGESEQISHRHEEHLGSYVSTYTAIAADRGA